MLRPSLWSTASRARIYFCTSCLVSRLPVLEQRSLYSTEAPARQTEHRGGADAVPPVEGAKKSRNASKNRKSKYSRATSHEKKHTQGDSPQNPPKGSRKPPKKTKGKNPSNDSVQEDSPDNLPKGSGKPHKKTKGKKRSNDAVQEDLPGNPPNGSGKAPKKTKGKKRSNDAVQAQPQRGPPKTKIDSKAKAAKGAKGSDFSTPLARSTDTLKTESLDPATLQIDPISTEVDGMVPRLSYGLDRVLFNPGIYHLQDPRSRLYNFDPYLRSIMPVSEFDFGALNEYITSSKDDKLREVAKQQGKKYIGSSSSMTGVLSHFHFLLSSWRPVTTSMLSRGFTGRADSFTRIGRSPNAVIMRYKDGVYAIDADKQFDNANLLMSLGISMEKLLTLPTDEYERYRKSSENKVSREEVRDETYHYSTFGDFLMRSQLDAHDPRLPGTGMFDLKSRAVLPIRMNSSKPEDGKGYQIRSRLGSSESFEREYYDLIRSAFLKYSLQVRIGRMDGIFVAYHNTERIFGFQYISLPEMDLALHGQEDVIGDIEFKLSLSLWNTVLEHATKEFPEKSLRFHFETRPAPEVPFMYIFAEPVDDQEIEAIQSRNSKRVEEVKNKMLHPELYQGEEGSKTAASDSQDTQKNEEKEGLAPESEDQSSESPEALDDISPDKPLLAMALSVENMVDGRRVLRPENLTADQKWSMKYRLSALKPERGREVYRTCRRRRQTQLESSDEEEESEFRQKFLRGLKIQSDKGAKWRAQEDLIEKEQGILTFD